MQCSSWAGSSQNGTRPTTAGQFSGRAAARGIFYRDRWSHDKVVRSTHGVNCTGSCSWKVYGKDGIITWESQQTDYPSVGPDTPEYEPRGCPRGADLSLREVSGESTEILLPCFEQADGTGTGTGTGTGSVLRRGAPVIEVEGQLVSTVFDLMLAQDGVGREGLPGDWATGTRTRVRHCCHPVTKTACSQGALKGI